jgi:hypothetical protein
MLTRETQLAATAEELDRIAARFDEYPPSIMDARILYRGLLPRPCMRLDVDLVSDPLLRELLGNGVVGGEETHEVGLLILRQERRDLHVSCRLAPDGPERPLFRLRNVRNRLCVARPVPQ